MQRNHMPFGKKCMGRMGRGDWDSGGPSMECVIISDVRLKSSQTPLLDFENVTVLRGGRPALRSLSLKISVGEHTVIFGPNGSGKSTFIKTITRECYPVPGPRTAFKRPRPPLLS